MKEALLESLKRNKNLLVAAGLLALITLGLYVSVSTYLAPAVIAAQAQWNDLRSRTAAIGRGDVTSVYAKGQADLRAFEERIPLKRQFPRVLGDLMESASSSGVTIGSLSYKPERVKDENLLAYVLTLKVGGRYAAQKSFLADLLSSREMVVVDGFSLSNSDAFEEYVVMDLHLTVYLREGA